MGKISVVWVLALLGACVPQVHVHVSNEVSIQGGLGLEPGDRVIGRYKDNLFLATVVTVRKNLVTVAWDAPPPEQSHLPRGWVARIAPVPAGTPPETWAACSDGESLVLCQVLGRHGDALQIRRAGELRERNLERAYVLALPSGLEGWAAEAGARQQLRLARAAMLSTLVPATAGELPKPGGTVLARWRTDGEWWPGAVENVSGDTVRVRWHDGTGSDELPRTNIAPLAPAEPNAFAFCSEGGTARYERAFVRWVTGNLIEIEQRDGSVRELPLGSCVPARPVVPLERAPVLP